MGIKELIGLSNESIAMIIIVVLWLLHQSYEKHKEREAKKNSVVKVTRADKKVWNFIKEIAAEFNIDRCYIIQFSNGGTFQTGRDIRRLSMTNEYNRPGSGLNYVATQLSDVLVNGEFVELLDDLLDKRIQLFPDVSKIPPKFNMKVRQMEASNLKSGYNVLLERPDVRLRGEIDPIGVFSIYFQNHRQLTEAEIYNLSVRCGHLQKLLTE